MWIPSNYSLCLSLNFPGRIKYCGIVVIKKILARNLSVELNNGNV